MIKWFAFSLILLASNVAFGDSFQCLHEDEKSTRVVITGQNSLTVFNPITPNIAPKKLAVIKPSGQTVRYESDAWRFTQQTPISHLLNKVWNEQYTCLKMQIDQ